MNEIELAELTDVLDRVSTSWWPEVFEWATQATSMTPREAMLVSQELIRRAFQRQAVALADRGGDRG